MIRGSVHEMLTFEFYRTVLPIRLCRARTVFSLHM